MKILFYSSLLLVLFSACSKNDTVPEPHKPAPDPIKDFPDMLITELNDDQVKYKQSKRLDLDHDGVNDMTFGVWYIGNPNQNEDELLYFASSGVESSLMIGEDNGSPRFNKNEIIPITPLEGYNWYIVSMVELAMKNTGFVGAPYWEKGWKDANHQYLAVQVKRNGRFYYGWVELSMDTVNSVLVLHRAGISKTADKAVKAGVWQ